MLLWVGTKQTCAPQAIIGHLKREALLLSALLRLTHCPSLISLWCAAWRPSCDHGWGGPPAPASSGPGFHSSRAKVGGTNPPHSSVEAGEGGEGWRREKMSREKHRESVNGGVNEREIDREGKTEWGWQIERETQIRRWKYTVALGHTKVKKSFDSSTLRARERPKERTGEQTEGHRFVQISLSVLLLFATNVCSLICQYSFIWI